MMKMIAVIGRHSGAANLTALLSDQLSFLRVLFMCTWVFWFPTTSQRHADNCAALDLPRKRKVEAQK